MRSKDHNKPYCKNPDNKCPLKGYVVDREYNKRDQCNTCNSISFKTIGSRTNAVTGIVSCTVCNNSRVSGIIFGELKKDLHHICTYVSDLGKYSPSNSESGSSQRFTNSKPYQTCSGASSGNKEQDEEHHGELNRYKQ